MQLTPYNLTNNRETNIIESLRCINQIFSIVDFIFNRESLLSIGGSNCTSRSVEYSFSINYDIFKYISSNINDLSYEDCLAKFNETNSLTYRLSHSWYYA